MLAVDPIEATIPIAGELGLQVRSEYRPDPNGYVKYPAEPEELNQRSLDVMTASCNKEKKLDLKGKLDQRKVISATRGIDGRVLAQIQESPNEARLRWQKEVSPKSFHSSIIASAKNHSQVTAYDVAIGSGKASSDPAFYAYLCAVADWRIQDKKSTDKQREGIRKKSDFLSNFSSYLSVERAWRKAVIDGTIEYYNSGILPSGLPLLSGPLWKIIISETRKMKRVTERTGKK